MNLPTFKAYLELTKPRIVLLLTFTTLVSYIVAAKKLGHEPFTQMLLISLLAITAGTAGCNAVTCFIDRDIDRKMKRTKRRPLPTNRISPSRNALYFGVTLLTLGVALSLLINIFTFFIGIVGVFDNVIVYSYYLKRRTPLSIILGGFSGGVPVLFGWVSATNGWISLLPLLIMSAVVVWIPSHIWNLALYYKTDYMSVGVPMLPVVVEEKRAIRWTVSTVPILFIFTMLIGVVGNLGIIYMFLVLPLGVIILIGNIYTMYRPLARNLWLMYKISSPYLVILFLALMIDILQ